MAQKLSEPIDQVRQIRQIRIVLVRPQGSANVGSIARVMKNMGLSDLAVVQPECDLDHEWARAMAVHARDLLTQTKHFDSLAAAVADCVTVVGTTAKQGPYRVDPRPPRDLLPELLANTSSGRLALVFGPEDHGLSNTDLKYCGYQLSIPTGDEYVSLNLAQAVAICCYELRLAVQQHKPMATRPLATSEDTEFMFDRLQEALLSIGFLLQDNPDHIMYSLRRMLGRAELEEQERKILLGIARQIEWYGKHGSE